MPNIPAVLNIHAVSYSHISLRTAGVQGLSCLACAFSQESFIHCYLTRPATASPPSGFILRPAPWRQAATSLMATPRAGAPEGRIQWVDRAV
jgi:hypothetical protein